MDTECAYYLQPNAAGSLSLEPNPPGSGRTADHVPAQSEAQLQVGREQSDRVDTTLRGRKRTADELEV